MSREYHDCDNHSSTIKPDANSGDAAPRVITIFVGVTFTSILAFAVTEEYGIGR